MTDWRDKLRELGFGNQAVIVGTKRRELFDEIEKMFVERQKVLELIDKMPAMTMTDPNNNHPASAWKLVDKATLRQQIKEMK